MTAPQHESLAALLASQSVADQQSVLKTLKPNEIERLEYEWAFWARQNQLQPQGDYRTWLVLAGRGFGKTRVGAETVRHWVESGRYKRIAIVARTSADCRKVMVEGESGILAVCPPWNKPLYEPSQRSLTWPNGALVTTYSAEDPKLLRGPQHDACWADEIATWQRPEAWDMLMFGLRLGDDPRAVVTTTPTPSKLIKDLLAATSTHVTRGSTYDNRANLAPAFFSSIITKYEGTRLGRQELLAEVLDDVPGALWTRATLDACRTEGHPDLMRLVVAIDPAVTSKEDSDCTGIVAAGLGIDGHGYVLADLTCKMSPEGWARRAVNAYYHYQADCIVAEANNGGDLVASVIRSVDGNVPVELVHASRGKHTRAEPIASFYEQNRVHHAGDGRNFDMLEDEMCNWSPSTHDASPDRMDALVWALTKLLLDEAGQHIVTYEDRVQISAY